MSLRIDDFRCSDCEAIFKDVSYSWDTEAQGPHSTHAALDCPECGGLARVVWLQGRAKFGGLGRRTSSGESLDRGTAYLAAMHFGACVKDGDKMRAPQTEGELTRQLAQHNMHRGTTREWGELIEAKTERRDEVPPSVERSPDEIERDVARIAKRREHYRNQYDLGAVPRRDHSDLPLDVRSQMPTPAAVSVAASKGA